MSGYEKKELICSCGNDTVIGNIFVPADGQPPFPAVILSHGYNSAGSDMDDLSQSLAENGVIAYSYDFRGGSTRSKSSGSSLDMSIFSEQDDLLRVIDMISALDICDEKRLYLYGESQGGFVSALTAADMPERIAGLFLLYPAFCIPDQWLGRSPDEPPEKLRFMGMQLSGEFRRGLPEYDVYEHIAKFSGPVKIFHGDNDRLVALSYSERLAKAFPDASLSVFAGAGHGFTGSDRAALIESITKYFS